MVNANSAFVPSFFINVPVANLYAQADPYSSVVSQAIYGVDVARLAKQGDWYQVTTPDAYQGWLEKSAVIKAKQATNSQHLQVVSLFAHVYKKPDVTLQRPLMTLPFGARLALRGDDTKGRWLPVRLLDGRQAMIQSGDVVFSPSPLDMSAMLSLAQQFIGLPYTWGGLSSYGFDCSGLVQVLFQQMGVALPRDAWQQAQWPGFVDAPMDSLQAGDVLFFTEAEKSPRVTHVGVYVGDKRLLNATTLGRPMVQVNAIDTLAWTEHYKLVSAKRLPAFSATVKPVPVEIAEDIANRHCPVSAEELAYLQLLHWGFDGQPKPGELIVHRDLADEVIAIFEALYQQRFPIEKMRLISDYQGDDKASMADNNTSAFNCRLLTGSRTRYSQHSYGRAIDINPKMNPYVKGNQVIPETGKDFIDRRQSFPGKVDKQGLVYRLFAKYGWDWGGRWRNVHDYQHFEKRAGGKRRHPDGEE